MKGRGASHTSLSGTNGGPAAISAAFVPGCIRREELASRCDCSISVVARVAAGPPEGEFGPIWISAGGGGLGRRGELGARDMIWKCSAVLWSREKAKGERKYRIEGGRDLISSSRDAVDSLASYPANWVWLELDGIWLRCISTLLSFVDAYGYGLGSIRYREA